MTTSIDTDRGGWGELLGPKYLGTTLVLAGGVALYAINVYLTTSLLPTAVDDIGGARYYAWTMTVFLVASVISSMLVSRALLSLGAVRAYLIGFGVFVAGSLICALSPTMEILLVGRATQGLGGGLLAGLGFAVIQTALPKHLWTRGAAVESAMWGVGNFMGPAIGGLFAQFGSWRMAFGMLAVSGLLIGLVVPRAIPSRRHSGTATSTPVVSLVLLTVATAVVSVAGIVPRGVPTAATVAVSVLLVLAFLAWERGAHVRVLPAATFLRRSPLRWIYLTIALLAVGIGTETFIPLFGQELGGLPPLAAGFLGAALSLGWSMTQFVSSSVESPSAIRRMRVSGPLVLAAGLVAYGLLQREDASGVVIASWVVALVVAGTGIGMAFPHLAVAAMSSSEDEQEGAMAAAGINTVLLISNAFSAAAAGVLVNLGEPSIVRSAHLLLFGFAVAVVLGSYTSRRIDRAS